MTRERDSQPLASPIVATPDRIARIKSVIKDPEQLKARSHPLDTLKWRDPRALHANGWNPNRVFTPEMQLLKQSILEDGWTQPIVIREDVVAVVPGLEDQGEQMTYVIVDGFHRFTLGSHDEEIRAISNGLVPTVLIDPTKSKADQQIATIRHNRARGVHGILAMSSIVQDLKTQGLTDEQIRERLGMEQEEIDRLSEVKGSPDTAGKDSFGRGWTPKPSKYKFEKVKAETKKGIKPSLAPDDTRRERKEKKEKVSKEG